MRPFRQRPALKMSSFSEDSDNSTISNSAESVVEFHDSGEDLENETG